MGITKHIPNTITSLNLFSGVAGVMFVFQGRLDLAFYCMIAGAVFDVFDGLAVRALGAYTNIGKELDSLADMITFGVLPALMLHYMMIDLCGNTSWSYIPLLMPIFAALRLAKFNIDERQTTGFIGLATPASALLCGALVHYIQLTSDSIFTNWAGTKVFIPLLVLVICALMVMEIPMFSLKTKKDEPKESRVYRLRGGLFGACVAYSVYVLLIGQKFSLIIILGVLTYIIINLVNWIVNLVRGVK